MTTEPPACRARSPASNEIIFPSISISTFSIKISPISFPNIQLGVCVVARLSADAKFRNDFLVSTEVFYLQVVKKLSSFADQLEQPAPGMVVF
jgi:hypothetical protein